MNEDDEGNSIELQEQFIYNDAGRLRLEAFILPRRKSSGMCPQVGTLNQ